MRALLVLCVGMAVGLAGCQDPSDPTPPLPPSQPPVSAAQPAAQTPPPQAAAPTPAPEPGPTVAAQHTPNPREVSRAAQAAMSKASTTYGTFRQQLMQTGWVPMNHGLCLQHVRRPDAAQLCAALPELATCESPYTCRMLFQMTKGSQVQSLTVMTEGPLEEWNKEQGSRLVVKDLLPNAPLPTPAVAP